MRRATVCGLFFAAGYLWATQTGMVSGFVREAETGEFLGYVSVYLADGSLGTSTNRQGYYVLSDVPEGKTTIVVSMIGYEEQQIEIEVEGGSRLRRDFYLKRAPLGMEPVEITAERARFEHDVDVGIKRMDFTEIKQVPGFVEQDLFRALEMLPGVISVSDFTSALYIRGGTMDQNLILLDGVTVYNPYHLLGFFSTFILESLKGAELYTGGYPARYGGALSSVLDVEMKAGNSERLAGYGEIGLLTSKLVVEGPLPWGAKGSWLVAGRRTYIDAITWTLDKIFNPDLSIYLPYHFYDLQAKVNWDPSERSRFTLSGFFGDDVLNFKEEAADLDFRWGNGTLGLRWRYLFTPQLFSVLGFNATRYRVDSKVVEKNGEEYYYGLRSGIGELGLQWRLSWFVKSEHVIDFGLEGKVIETSSIQEETDTVFYDLRDTFWLAAAYVQDKWEPSPFWVVEIGVRGEYFSNGNYWRASPRVGIKRRVTADWALKAGAGLYYQYLYVPYPRDEMMLKMPIQFVQQWMPADERYPPLHSTLYTLGTERLFPQNMSLSVEVYYKDIRNIREATWFGGEGITTDTAEISLGRGYSYGAELLLKYGSSWLGYAYSVTKYRFEQDDWFYPLHDSRHNVNLSFALPLGKGWNLTAAWVFSSGFPFTAQIGWMQYVDPYGNIDWKPISGRRGDYRYPPYHRLDAGFTKSFKLFKRFDAEFYLQVLNVYARKNVLYYNYWGPDENGITHREAQYMLPIPVPSLGIRARL
jgi:hypothetical protein